MKKNLMLIFCAIGIHQNTIAMPQPHLPSMPKPKGIPLPPSIHLDPAVKHLVDTLKEPAVQRAVNKLKNVSLADLVKRPNSFRDIPGLGRALDGVKHIPGQEIAKQAVPYIQEAGEAAGEIATVLAVVLVGATVAFALIPLQLLIG